MYKKALCLIFAFLLSIENFAAVVSDNDGSAFITKAEYDSLKNNFQTQIDKYNTSIDSKIDDAIANYMAGIKVEANGKYPSLLHKAANVKSIKFVRTLDAPTSRIGGHHKWGGMIVYQRDNCFPTIKKSLTGLQGGLGLSDGSGDYYVVGGHHKFKIGFAKDVYDGQFDALKIQEENTANNQKNVVWRIKTDNDGNLYTEEHFCKDIVPISTVYMATIGGGYSSCTFKNNTDASGNTPTVTISGNFYDFSGRNKGQAFSTLTWTFGNVLYWNPNPYDISVSNTVDWEESDYSDDTTKEINYLSGSMISDSETLVGVADGEWDICHTESYATKSKIVYAWQYTYPKTWGAETKGVELGIVDINGYNPIHEASDIGLPSMRVWMKKYRNYKLNELIHNDWSLATNNIVKYYTGIPLFSSSSNGTVKVVLNLKNDTLSQSADIYIRDKAFTNRDTEVSNVELFSDVDKTTPITDLTMESGSANVEKTFYLDAKKDKTYWIRIKPSGTGVVTVDSESDFEVKYEK